MLVASVNVAWAQQSDCDGTSDTDRSEHAALFAEQKGAAILSKVPGVGRLFATSTSPTLAAAPDATGSKLQHLLQAAAHLEAAGETEQAQRLRQQADGERRALLNRLESLQAELDRLRQTAGCATQIMVQVRMMELSRTRMRKLGFDFSKLREDGVVSTTEANQEAFALNLIEADNPLLRVLEAMRDDNLVKVLAEPTLVTLSGRPACFNVGGQYPVLVPQADGSRVMEYRDYGTRVDLVAIALGKGRIRLEVRPRVSELVPEQSIQIGEYTFPGVKVREVDTRVEMQADQTLVLGGLVQTRVTKRQTEPKPASATPGAGVADEKPKEVTEETELLVLITPRILEPAVATSARLPSRRKPADSRSATIPHRPSARY
jgi:Flp pilus assembly secretin CpaC